MRIIPNSSFASSPIADFPALKMFFHEDDFSAGIADEVVTWTDRVDANRIVTITPTAGISALKDGNGVYADGVVTFTISGTMPTILATHYAVAVGIGKATDASSVSGASVLFGADGATNPAISSIGTARYNSANLNTPPTLAPTALTTLARPVCQVAYFDYVDTTSPRIERVVCNTNFTDAASMAFGAGTTTGSAAITPGAMANGINWSFFGDGIEGARLRASALFLFTTPVTYGELKIACLEMARTGELYAGWRNKT